MRNTYDKLEELKYTSANGNGNPYWYLSDLRENLFCFGAVKDLPCEIPGHCIKVKNGDKDDYALSVKACYDIATNILNDSRVRGYCLMNGDYHDMEIACEWFERIKFREILRDRDNDFSNYLKARGLNPAVIKSLGDKAMFGYTTREIKEIYNLPLRDTLYDYFSSDLLIAKIRSMDLSRIRQSSSIKDFYINNSKDLRLSVLTSTHREPIDHLVPHIDQVYELVDKYESYLFAADTSIQVLPFVI